MTVAVIASRGPKPRSRSLCCSGTAHATTTADMRIGSSTLAEALSPATTITMAAAATRVR